nr:MAG TPA: hypothetical protein [Caudoviricetes sp.]
MPIYAISDNIVIGILGIISINSSNCPRLIVGVFYFAKKLKYF